MAQHRFTLTGPLARAARALAGVSVATTASAAHLTKREVRDFEKSLNSLTPEQTAALQAALESLGAFFIADGANGRGAGVRLKFSESKARRVESWEDEGGLAAEDDV